MERDGLVMIYGAIMDIVGSIATSILTVLCQLWLERREFLIGRSIIKSRILRGNP
jgi:hypothetical protein